MKKGRNVIAGCKYLFVFNVKLDTITKYTKNSSANTVNSLCCPNHYQDELRHLISNKNNFIHPLSTRHPTNFVDEC